MKLELQRERNLVDMAAAVHALGRAATDMVDFTAISEHLGEEGTYALIQPVYDLMAAAIAEQGGSVVLRHRDGTVDFDAGAVAAALPASVQRLLTAWVDMLSAEDRALLQAAAVIGRRFDAELLAAITEARSDLNAHLTAMQRLGLVYHEEKSGDYAFKHALVRDALCQSLLSGPRAALHLKIASEIERRGDNRLAEVVDILAHHYRQTDRLDKAFIYLGMAGAKSSSVYSLDEADTYFTAAVHWSTTIRIVPSISRWPTCSPIIVDI